MAELGVAAPADLAVRNGHTRRSSGAGPVRRRGVPGGRAVLGGLLVAVAVVGLFYASTRTQVAPRQSYVIARHDIAPGVRLHADDLALASLDLPAAQASRAFRDTATLAGATTIAPLAAGEVVQASAVVAKPSGPSSREVTFAVPHSTLGEGVEQGERIDIVATYGSGPDAFSTVVLRQALVVGIDRGRARVGSQDDVAVTVAVDDATDAVALAHAVQLAKLTVVRSTGATAAAGGQVPPVYRQPTASARP